MNRGDAPAGKPTRTVRRRCKKWLFPVVVGLFVGVSWAVQFEPGLLFGRNFALFSKDMVLIIPSAFVLIGLFDVWVPRGVVERHLGTGSGLKGYLWSIVLASSTVGGLYVSFPTAAALARKGARLGVIFAYVGLSGIFRIPMTFFEISFLGVEFTLIRYLVSMPLVIGTSHLLGLLLEHRGFVIESAE